jgi:hypothetical protein
MRRLKLRIHEWLADHCRWVQYPSVRELREPARRRSVWDQYRAMTRRERGWFWFAVFWLSILGWAQLRPADPEADASNSSQQSTR